MKARAGLGYLLLSLLALGCGGGGTAGQASDEPPSEEQPDARVETTAGGRGGGSGGKGGTAGAQAHADAGSAPADAGLGGAPGPDAAAPRGGADGGTDTSQDGAPGASEAGVTPVGPPGPWARGVQVGLVEVAQAVFIKLGEGTAVVPPAERNGPLIEGRPLFVRVHVAAAAGFTARRLRAVLTLDYGDGMPRQLEDGRMISGSSNVEQIESTFNFLIAAADVKPKAGLALAVYETAEPGGPEPATLPRFPASGTADLAIAGGRMELDVVAIPVTGPGGPLADTPARRKKLEDHLYDLYPVQKVNVRWHEPVTIAAKLTSSSTGFTTLRTLRTKDVAKPYEYYHLLVAKEDTNFTFSGVGSVAGAGANDGARRVAITVVAGRAVDGNVDTTAHEIGHNHGRSHVPACGAAGPDPKYPYKNGDTGVAGFAFSEKAWKSRMRFRELMGYCRPRWLSDYTWRAFEARVRAVSALPRDGGGMTMAARSLQAFVGPAAPAEWGIVKGELVEPGTAMNGQRYGRVVLVDGSERMVPVAVQLLSDDVTREIALTLPPDARAMVAEVFVDGERFMVPVGQMPMP